MKKYHIPKIYIIVKQLSNANPTKNRHNVNVQNCDVNAVRTPAINPNTLHPHNDGIRPKRSAIHPNNKPPTIAPQKNIDCDIAGNAAFSQTHSCYITKIFDDLNLAVFFIYIFFSLIPQLQ